MPMPRSRGGSSRPCSGAETTAPPIEIVPEVGCSSPATHLSVVVLPQPEGPSSTTISPAATRKLTSSTAGLPVAKTLRRRSTFNSADMSAHPREGGLPGRSLPVTVDLVPFLDPGVAELLVLLHVRHPDLRDLRIEALGIDRRVLQRRQIAQLLDHEGLALFGEAPVQEQFRGVRMRGRLRDAGRIGIHGHALGREE